MPRCSTSILLHSAGGALERPTARTRYTYITYHTTLHYIPHDENTAAGRPRAGGWRRGGKNAALNGYAMKPRFTFVTDPTSGRRYGLYAWATSAYRTLVLKVHFDVEDDPSTWDVDPNWVAPSG